MQFDHAGIATDDLDGFVDLYVDLLGAEMAHRERFDGMHVAFLDLGNGYFEVLEPIDDEGAIARYLEKDGPGIHHLAVATDDVDGAIERAQELGIELIEEESRPGAWGHQVAFLHPRSTAGVLIEFVEHGSE